MLCMVTMATLTNIQRNEATFTRTLSLVELDYWRALITRALSDGAIFNFLLQKINFKKTRRPAASRLRPPPPVQPCLLPEKHNKVINT